MSVHEVPRLMTRLQATVRELNALFPGRPFTPDWHIVGSIGEVVAAYVYDLELAPCSSPGFDARFRLTCETVEIKLTAGKRINISGQDTYADKLIVLKLIDGNKFHEVYAGRFPIEAGLSKRMDGHRGNAWLSGNPYVGA